MEAHKLLQIVDTLSDLGITQTQYLSAVTAYERCALWSSIDSEGVPLDDEKYDPYSWSESAHDRNLEDVAKFLIFRAEEVHDFMAESKRDFGDVGHDLWLTRNGHGTGFWDRGFAGPAVDGLTDGAKALGGLNVYLSDDDEFEVE